MLKKKSVKGEKKQGVRKEGGFQRHSSVLTGAKHGKLDRIFRLCDFNTQTQAYITILNKCRANALYNLL